MAPPPPPPNDHDCAWREYAEHLDGELSKVQQQLEQLQRHVFGKKSEKLPPISKELRDSGTAPDPAEAQRKRKARAEKKRALPERRIEHKIPDERRCCPACGSRDLRPLGEGKITALYERLAEHFEKQVHVQEVLTCKCGEGVITAEAPARVYDKAQYGPGLIAHLVVSKCADSLPLHRLEKMYARGGIELSRSTMVDLFHRAAELLVPLSTRLLELVALSDLVQADETPLQVQAKKKTRRAYLWTFLSTIAEPLIGYRFSATRSGATPSEVLGTSAGTLVVDAYSGYNSVTTPEGRERVGCWAHVRRYFFEALPKAPETQQALDQIRELYRVEHEALALGIVRTAAHQRLRQLKSKPLVEAFARWLAEQKPKHLPKGQMGVAIRYAENQWEALTRFLKDARLPLDNNASERALRVVALGRKNFLFVGNDKAGRNLAGLYSLVATCEANEVNPQEYLADVLMRIQTHPKSRLDELLPHKWSKLAALDTG